MYLGIVTIRGAGLALKPADDSGGRRGSEVIARGFALQAANPKALLFFTALLPQFIDPRQDIAAQMVILAVTSIVIEFAVLGMYGYLAARIAHLARSDRFVRSTESRERQPARPRGCRTRARPPAAVSVYEPRWCR